MKIDVLIIPGHGGLDRSNVGPTDYVEADGVLGISKYLNEFLSNTGAFTTKITRDADTTVPASTRANIMRDFRPNVVIINHTNGGGGKGPEVFISKFRNNENLAAAISKRIADFYRLPDRGVKTKLNSRNQDWYADIRNAYTYGANVVLLIEYMFHDNLEEETILKSAVAQKHLAEMVAIELCKYYNIDTNLIYKRVDGVSSWAVEAMAWGRYNMYTDGTGPKEPLSLERFMTILYRYDQNNRR